MTRFCRPLSRSVFALFALFVVLGLEACSATHGTRSLGTLEVHTFRRDWTNAHLVVSSSGSFLVDSGLEANAEALDSDIRAAGLDPSTLRAIVLTHGHADHAGGARFFHERYGVPIVAGQADGAMLGDGHNDALCPTGDEARDRLEQDQAATFRALSPDVMVGEATDLEALTGIAGSIVPLPGHTPGSLVILIDGAAFVGDLFRGTVFTSGAEVHFYMCDLEDNRRDVHALLETLAPQAHTFFPGHFGPLTRDAVVDRFARSGE